MIIKPIEKHNRDIYQQCVKSYGTIFNSLEWIDIFHDGVNVYGIFNKNLELMGGFVLYLQKKYGFSIYRNPPFTTSIGPFLKIEARNPASVSDFWKKVISSIADFVDALSYSVISISMHPSVVDTQPFIWRKFKVSPRYTYVLDLTAPLDDIINRISSERRQNINRAVKDGLVVRQINEYGIIKSLVLKTFARQNKRLDGSYLNKILFEFASDSNSFAFVTYNGDSPLACSFCVYDDRVAYYLLGGYDTESKHVGAGTMAIWSSLNYAKKMGLKSFDFEGSMVPQIERYFRGFGASLIPYYQVNKASLPIEILLKFLKREIF